MQTDNVVGEVSAALQRIGATQNTLVIFTSDNGCSKAADIAALARQGHRVSAHMRGSKADIWDGGHRIPFIVRWPQLVRAGTQCDQLICLTDLFATVADQLQADIPAGTCEDSVSFLPALSGQPVTSTRAGVVHHSYSGHFAYRQGPWKLILARGSAGWTKPQEKDLDNSVPKAQLYNLDTDPGEANNLYTAQPDVAERLLTQLQRDIRTGRSTAGPASDNDVSGIVLWKSEAANNKAGSLNKNKSGGSRPAAPTESPPEKSQASSLSSAPSTAGALVDSPGARQNSRRQ